MMETKQVIVIRKDLKMRKGKCVAQGAHASMKVLLDLMQNDNNVIQHEFDGMVRSASSYRQFTRTLTFNEGSELDNWLNGIFTKITASVDSEAELELLYYKAKEAGIPCSMIEDVGKTEFNGVLTKTCIAIGPAEVQKIDKITSHLPLL